jgi:hypothetical protein
MCVSKASLLDVLNSFTVILLKLKTVCIPVPFLSDIESQRVLKCKYHISGDFHFVK